MAIAAPASRTPAELTIALAVVVALAVVAALITRSAIGPSGSRALDNVGLLAAIVLWGLGSVSLRGQGWLAVLTPSVVGVLDRFERRRVHRVVCGARAEPPSGDPVEAGYARQLIDQGSAWSWFVAGMAVATAGQSLGRFDAFGLGPTFSVLSVVFAVVLSAFVVRIVRARRFLDAPRTGA